GDMEELGGHHPWRQRGGVDPGAAQLVAERLGEVEDEALGGRVAGVQGRGLVGADRGGGGDVGEPWFHHVGKEQLGQVDRTIMSSSSMFRSRSQSSSMNRPYRPEPASLPRRTSGRL